MKKAYITPHMEIDRFDCESIVCTSGWGLDDGFDEESGANGSNGVDSGD